jgi:prefoldin subunit 5
MHHLHHRLQQLQQEYQKGQQKLQELDQERKALYETMLRISGAMQVIRELIENANGQEAPAPEAPEVLPQQEE